MDEDGLKWTFPALDAPLYNRAAKGIDENCQMSIDYCNW